jgi:glutamine synthetase
MSAGGVDVGVVHPLENVTMEYLWMGGGSTDLGLDNVDVRHKTRVFAGSEEIARLSMITTNSFPENMSDADREHARRLLWWTADGVASHHMTAAGGNSDIVLRPVTIFCDPRDPARPRDMIAVCEVYSPDGAPSEFNRRTLARKADTLYSAKKMWFGYEQEYIVTDTEHPEQDRTSAVFNFEPDRYYATNRNWGSRALAISERHRRLCLGAGVPITGVSSERERTQWEYHVGTCKQGAAKFGDMVVVSRFLLMWAAQSFGKTPIFASHPFQSWDENRRESSGGHTHFSSLRIRTASQTARTTAIEQTINNLEREHAETLKAIASVNDMNAWQRIKEPSVLGAESARIEFLRGSGEVTDLLGNRSTSVRLPTNVEYSVAVDGTASGTPMFPNRIEDRRPGASSCPYTVAAELSRLAH